MRTSGTIHEFVRTRFALLLWVVAFLFLNSAGAQTEVSGLTDDELVEQFHREAFREEFFRRIADYTAEEREAAMAKLHDNPYRRRFPQEYTEEELFEYIRNPSDKESYHNARNELQQRFVDASSGEVTALAERLRAAFKATPYPVFGEAGFDANSSTYNALSFTAKECLPEEVALNLLREVYLESGQKGAITQFLRQLRGDTFTGPATLAVVEELAAQVADYDDRKLNELGEHESLQGIIGNLIRQCSDNSFEAIKAREWREDKRDIILLGTFEDPEARSLLLEYYASISRELLYTKWRLDVLRALMERWDREHDGEFRLLLRADLAEMLNLDHNGNPYVLGKCAEVIGLTEDPYYIPLLKKRRASLDLDAIRRAANLPEDQLEATLNTTMNSFDEAIATLERARAGEAQQ